MHVYHYENVTCMEVTITWNIFYDSFLIRFRILDVHVTSCLWIHFVSRFWRSSIKWIAGYQMKLHSLIVLQILFVVRQYF